MKMEAIPKSKIFFDGNCVICDMEIAHYKRVLPEAFELVDISSKTFDAAKFNLTPKDVETNMHVLTPEGDLKIGVEAFAHIWSRIPRYQWASRVVALPVVSLLARLGYKSFTIVRPYLPKKNRTAS